MFTIPGGKRNIWGHVQRPESGLGMGYNFMVFIMSLMAERIFITDICGQMVANADMKLSFVEHMA